MSIPKTRGLLYTLIRLGHVQAVPTGRVGKRVTRRAVGRAVWRVFR